MNVLAEVSPTILRAFLTTIELTLLSAVASLFFGLVVATMAVSPIPPLRWTAAAYVRLVRNTPLPVTFFMVVFGLPQLDIRLPFFVFALIALTAYTTTFVAEALRSGIRAVPVGQVEAAKSIGMSFAKTLRYVVLPQAARSVVPPLANILVLLFKFTSVAGAFGVTEATGTMTSLVNANPREVLLIMMYVAALYVLGSIGIGRSLAWLERRVAIVR